MKATKIRFFSHQENNERRKEKKATKSEPITGYISATGKLVFPVKAFAQLGFKADENRFKVGTQEGKRKIKSLFLIPAADDETESFGLEKAAKSYGIPLGLILQKGGVDYTKNRHTFTVKPFEYEAGVTGYELQLTDQSPKPEYTGKPRGRKAQPKVAAE